ncbi:MAG TPA: glycosyltransferase family 4 protein [Segetibacter sp.]
MKILFLSHSFYPAVGGIETFSEFLANAFHNAGYEVHLTTWTKEKGKKEFPFKIIRSPRLFQLLQEHLWADLVFENNPTVRLGWPALLLARPSIITLHTWIARINGTRGWQDKFKFHWLKRAKKVLAVSEALRKHSWPSATVIPNAYREDIFTIVSSIPKTRDFVFLGRLVSDKGAALAIEALSIIINEKTTEVENKNLTLTIIGDGPERLNLETLASELRIRKHIEFKGSVTGEELVFELNKHKYLLVPSTWEEPFGIVALEGMGCGCIPIVSDGGGLPEAIGNAGVVFERGNVAEFVSVTKQLLENLSLQQKLKNEAPAHLLAHHSKIIAGKYLQVLDNVLSKKV